MINGNCRRPLSAEQVMDAILGELPTYCVYREAKYGEDNYIPNKSINLKYEDKGRLIPVGAINQQNQTIRINKQIKGVKSCVVYNQDDTIVHVSPRPDNRIYMPWRDLKLVYKTAQVTLGRRLLQCEREVIENMIDDNDFELSVVLKRLRLESDVKWLRQFSKARSVSLESIAQRCRPNQKKPRRVKSIDNEFHLCQKNSGSKEEPVTKTVKPSRIIKHQITKYRTVGITVHSKPPDQLISKCIYPTLYIRPCLVTVNQKTFIQERRVIECSVMVNEEAMEQQGGVTEELKTKAFDDIPEWCCVDRVVYESILRLIRIFNRKHSYYDLR